MARETRPGASAPVKELETKFQRVGVQVVRPEATWRYVRRHKDLPAVVLDAAHTVRERYADLPMVLELVPDPEVDDEAGDTLVLYLGSKELTPDFFAQLDDWNHVVAKRMVRSEAWFIVDFDLRKRS